MPRPPTVNALMAAMMVAMAAGCTTAAPLDDPPGSLARIEPINPMEPKADVPRVREPLDASRFLADPCAVLTEEQVAVHGTNPVGVPNPNAGGAGPACLWHDDEQYPDTHIGISVGWLVVNAHGLSDTYWNRERFDDYLRFDEVEVAGYPGVINYYEGDDIHGHCAVTVGVSNSLTFMAYIQGGGSISIEHSCDVAVQIASHVIQALKESQ